MFPLPAVFKRRSSWPSSFVTSLIGWNGLTTLAALAFGHGLVLPGVLPIVSACAVIQVLVLRARLGLARRSTSLTSGAIAGAASAVMLTLALPAAMGGLVQYGIPIALVAASIGAPVGAFLSYFRRDDARIEAAARAQGRPIDYGRDAHWLDPFVYGAVGYVIVFPSSTFWSAAIVAIVGAMVGVVAAGVSHFVLTVLGNALITIPIAAALGAPLGAGTGLLLYGDVLLSPDLCVRGALAGALCFAVTAAVGRTLAVRERVGAT